MDKFSVKGGCGAEVFRRTVYQNSNVLNWRLRGLKYG